MKLLANENFPHASVKLLRNAGFDVLFIAESHRSIADTAVMRLGIGQKRAILTHDRDYGELVFRFGMKPIEGVVYFRIQNYLPEDPGNILLELLKNKDFQIKNRFTVIDSVSMVRQRGIPK